MKKKKLKIFLLLILLFILLTICILEVNVDYKNLVIHNKEEIYISEILASNKSIIKDEDHDYSDYIEIYNNNEHEINLKNFFLSDETMSTKKWIFPDLILKPKEYLIVFADSKDKCNLELRECHTNFKLSTEGETITLINNKGKIINKLKYSNIEPDTSYSLVNEEYIFTYPTPNEVNSSVEIIYNDKDIIINEVSSTSPEAIELKNLTNKDIDLSNYYLKDSSNTKFNLENITIKANSYLVLYGKTTDTKQILLNFRINNNGEIIELYKNSQLIDKFIVGKTNNNTSKGRNENLDIITYKEKTIGKDNSKTSYLGYSESPQFEQNIMYVTKGTKITLKTNDNSTIYYTSDGSTPTTKSTKYKDGITINKTVVIKAISYKEGYVESDVESRTFIVGRKHDMPVVSLSTNSSNLYGTNGILVKGNNASPIYPYFGANFHKDIEIPITFEYYENEKLGINFNAGMGIFGNWSRGEAQKSLDINISKEYGQNEITYPFFENNINTFSGLLLRSSGQDYGNTKIKDAFLHEVLEGQMDIDKQDYKSVVVYINGKYFGIYNLREKTNKQYIENHYDAKDKNIDLIRYWKNPLEGTIDDYEALLNWIRTHDMKTDEAYEYLNNHIDLQELINYWIVETYFGQADPGNMKFYKIEGGKWRWILFDLDLTFNSSTIRWNLPFSATVPGHEYKIDPTIMKNAINNPKIREMYIKTWAQHIKTTFKPDRMHKILDSMVKDIEKEMPYHIDRWYSESIYTSKLTIYSMNHWRNNISTLKRAITNRYNYAINNIKQGLGLTNEEYQKYFKN